MANTIYQFFKDHIKMSMYGMRCEIWNHFGLDPEAKEVDEKNKAIFDELKKIDGYVNDCIKKIDGVAIVVDTDEFDITAFDTYRKTIENATVECREATDKVMCDDVLRNRLFEIAMEKQREAQRQQQMAQAKAAVNPVNISGAPSDFGGATTVKMEKKEDGSVELKPVQEGNNAN